ncbi:MAG: hypothetical protein NXY57DRAFT_1043320 [Lentinula lateritia]|nr:MAG: hypothetical protein NXY57DRAFT_1043320 [Lentinula lateritia]
MYLHYYSSGYKAYLIVILGFLSIFTTAVPHQDSSLSNKNPADVASSVQQLGSSILPRQKGTYPHFSVQLQFWDRGKSSDEKRKKKQVATTAVQALLNLAILDLGFSSIRISQVEGFPVVNTQGNVDFRITLLPLKDEPATIYDGLVNLSSNAVNGHLSRSSMVIVKIVNGIVQQIASSVRLTTMDRMVNGALRVPTCSGMESSQSLSEKTCFTQRASAEALVPAQESDLANSSDSKEMIAVCSQCAI